MAKIAVYSGNSYCMEVIRGYINNAETKFGMKNQTAYFESVDMLEWDMETSGMFDLVIVHRSWEIAGLLRRKYQEINLMMVALGMSRKMYEVQPCYQVYEPMSETDFMRVFMSAVGGIEKSPCFVFSTGWVKYRLNVHEIMYFESDKRKVNIKGLYGDYSFYGNMRDLSERIKKLYTGFVRVHSSYIVNIEYVRGYSSRQITLLDGTRIGINDKWRPEVMDNIAETEMASIRHISTILC